MTNERSHLKLVPAASDEAAARGCPSDEALILYATLVPDEHPDDEDLAELLDGWTIDRLQRHLQSCDRCQQSAQGTAALTGALRQDRPAAPAQDFWDALADDVMAAVDRDVAAASGSALRRRSSVVEMPAERRDAVARQRTHDGRVASWSWAVAAAAALTLAVGAYLWDRSSNGSGPDHDDGMVDGGLAGTDGGTDGAVLVPDEQTAAALAAELGLSLRPFDAVAAAEEHFEPVGGAFDEAGMSSLRSLIEGSDVEALDLALVDASPLDDLVELDSAELASLLEALES